MEDIVRHFEKISINNGWVYTYGTTGHLNLKMGENHNYLPDGSVELDERFFLLAEPTQRRYGMSTGGNEVLQNVTYTGAIMLVRNSRFGDPYFAEQNEDPLTYDDDIKKSKYVMHVEPLLKLVPDMIRHFVCEGITVVSWEVVDWIDFLDENRDGIMIRYVLQDEF